MAKNTDSEKREYYFLKDNECVKIYEYPDKITFSHYISLEDCEKIIINECSIDSDCVPSSCCHAESCASIDQKPDCFDIFCSQECSGPLDCNAGSCKCVKGECKVISNE